ncbi:RecA/RadA recombinase [Desulfocurvibacter africanus PCS]|uniref:RecA/RadA recombinase n=1 Tax=Desulfocurvibacter africanus PCS TaxID=1262666 RepID=M5PSQ3_DESAF|nr:ATP-binding protein [Desulfocurvibacter africanus]EMG37149.1 RecA/RadA recombinase [Desulfocurvibacter africanus PCS]
MFRKAERRASKLRLALVGPSGSGKTYSALLISKGLGGRVALIDTERGSGELYSHLLDYDAAQLNPPFSPEKYIQAIRVAEKAGYDVLIIDSLSHAWTGEGGVLDLHDRASKSVKNTFAAWREVTPQHNALVDAILASPCHIVVTMRTKTAYEVSNENGKAKMVKVGLAPVQRDGLEYEFTVVMDLSVEGHVASASKDRTGIFDGQHIVPGEETGRALKAWLEGGALVAAAPSIPEPFVRPPKGASFLMDQLFGFLDGLGLMDRYQEYHAYVCARYGARDIETLAREQLIEQINLLRQCRQSPEKREQLIAILNQQRKAA